MHDAFDVGTTPSTWMSIVATMVGVLAIVFALGGFVARWLDRRGERDEFSTEHGRHDWRGRRRRNR